jgi:predicted DNA-binding protein
MAHLKLASTKIPIELMERLNKCVDSTRMTQSAVIRCAIEQFLDNVEQVSVESEDVELAKEKVTRRFGTPKDRQSIENLKRIYLLDQMGFYEPFWAFFEPTSQSVVFHLVDPDSNLECPDGFPPAVMLWSLWGIPDEHPSFSDKCIHWEWEIHDRELNGQLKESLECLKTLDEILVRPTEKKYAPTMLDEAAWEKRICGFFRGDFERTLTSTQEALILEFVESCMARVSKELDEFYVSFVEIQV